MASAVRNRTAEISPEFASRDIGVSKEFVETRGAAVMPGKGMGTSEFTKGAVGTERFGDLRSQNLRPDPEAWLKQHMAEAQRREYQPLGQIVQIWLGGAKTPRDLDFQKQGPLLAVNRQGELLVVTPVYSLPARAVLRSEGREFDNTEKLSPRQLRALARSKYRVKPVATKIESYATHTWNSYYVLRPLIQILIKTLDHDAHFMYVNFPVPDENRAVLYDPRTGQMLIHGGRDFALQ